MLELLRHYSFTAIGMSQYLSLDKLGLDLTKLTAQHSSIPFKMQQKTCSAILVGLRQGRSLEKMVGEAKVLGESKARPVGLL